MELERDYPQAVFAADDLIEAVRLFEETVGAAREQPPAYSVRRGNERWTFDNADEFWSEYRAGFDSAHLTVRSMTGKPTNVQVHALTIHAWHPWTDGRHAHTEMTVNLPERAQILRVLAPLDAAATSARVPEPPLPPPVAPTVFIGHGHSTLWRDLKDHLHEKHGYEVAAYETGERAGHAIRDILETMAAESSFALLVMTGEDVQPDGSLRARQNVVHELGLFQGSLGFSRALVLLEAGTEEFSNIHGIHQVRFAKGNIREAYGDVLAALRREFPRP